MAIHTPPPRWLLVALAGALATGRALAADDDGDGWDDTTSTPPDCNDDKDTIHPHAAEDGVDDVDEDCDDSVLIHRIYVSSMNNLVTADFTLGVGASQSGPLPDDLVTFTVGAGATMTMNDDFTFDTGVFTVVLRAKAISGGPATCYVKVASSSMAETTRSFSTVGTHVLAWPGVQPGDTVTDLKVECTGGTGTVDLDWLTVQNGTYRYGPLNDVSASATTMGLPGVGRQSVVRSSIDSSGGVGTLMFVGSDVGGLGWSDDGLEWKTANGRGSEWDDGGEYGVWEVWALDEASLSTQSVVVLTGDKDNADDGGLWYTDNLDSPSQSWTKAPGGLGASKHVDDCTNLDFKPLGSGQLIVNEPSDTTGTRFLVASQDPDTTGLWIWDKDSADPYYTPTQQTFNGSLPDALPSALAIDSSGTWLLVGYRVIASTGVESGALYVCPADFDAATVDDCELAASDADAEWVGDVRDIEADPVEPGVFYVADGGRRWDDTNEECDTGESTVFLVEVSGASWPPTISVADTDDDTAATEPAWAADSSGGGQDYYSSSACNLSPLGADVYGDLVAPRGSAQEGTEISSVLVDPSGTYLFAFYPLNDGYREYGCVRNYRVLTADVAAGVTPWRPFQGWEYGNLSFTSSTHASARRSGVEVYGAFMDSEPLLEDWAGAGVHDAAFVDGGDAQPELLVGGNFLWRALPETATTYGWDTADPSPFPAAWDDASTVLDEVQWELAWDGTSAVLQDATAKSIAVCPGCQQETGGVVDLTLAAGVGDYKMARLYGKGTGSPRTPASRSCEVHKLDSTGYDVSIWDGGGVVATQAWMSLVPQNADDNTDPNADRGLLYLADVTTDTWCWDAVKSEGIAGSNYLRDSNGDLVIDLTCQDSALVILQRWDPCYAVENFEFALGDAGVGQIVSLEAIDDATALLAAVPGVPKGGGSATGEGLWLATYSSATGISYAEIPFPAAGITFGAATCTESEFFAYTSQVKMVFDPASDPGGTTATAYLTSKHADCGLVKVVFDATDPTDATTTTWSAVTTSPCTLDTEVLRGLAISRDGHWLLTYGGPHSASYPGGVCAIDLTGVESPAQVVNGSDLTIQFQTALAHPHIDDTFYLGGFTASGATHAGVVIALQRRYRPDTATWNWAWRKLSRDDLEHRTIWDMAWGTGNLPRGNALKQLYLATSGGGFWDLFVVAE